MDTIGSLIDKLLTADLKMWNNQEHLYKIRKMTLEEFTEYYSNEENIEDLFKRLKKSSDLNYQRSSLMDEIDQKIVEIISAAKNGEDLDAGKFIQRKHKTY